MSVAPFPADVGLAIVCHDNRDTLGATLAFAVNKQVVSLPAAERRLHVLCRGDSAQAHRQLPRVLALVRESQIPVDWAALETFVNEVMPQFR